MPSSGDWLRVAGSNSVATPKPTWMSQVGGEAETALQHPRSEGNHRCRDGHQLGHEVSDISWIWVTTWKMLMSKPTSMLRPRMGAPMTNAASSVSLINCNAASPVMMESTNPKPDRRRSATWHRIQVGDWSSSDEIHPAFDERRQIRRISTLVSSASRPMPTAHPALARFDASGRVFERQQNGTRCPRYVIDGTDCIALAGSGRSVSHPPGARHDWG